MASVAAASDDFLAAMQRIMAEAGESDEEDDGDGA